MSYENAPATKLLGTHCLCCNRPLVDAASVTANVGPDCREKYGYNVEIPEEARAEANVIVHRIAADTSAATVEQDIARLRALGLTILADRLVARLGAEPVVTITVDGANLIVKTPYNATFVETLKSAVAREARVWQKATWAVAASAKAGLWTALRAAFAGEVGLGPKGRFTIEGAASVPAHVPAPAPTSAPPADGEPPAEFVREDGSVDCAAWGESLMPKATPAPVMTNFTAPEGSYSRDRIHRAGYRRAASGALYKPSRWIGGYNC